MLIMCRPICTSRLAAKISYTHMSILKRKYNARGMPVGYAHLEKGFSEVVHILDAALFAA